MLLLLLLIRAKCPQETRTKQAKPINVVIKICAIFYTCVPKNYGLPVSLLARTIHWIPAIVTWQVVLHTYSLQEELVWLVAR